MRNLRNCFVFFARLFIECSYPLMAAPLKDLTTNISTDATVYSSHARTLEEFNFDGRIVGGFVTSIANYPYQVSLQYHNAHICGGSIVAPNIILTAAHCIEQPWDTTAFRVRVGSSTHLYGGRLLDVHHIFKHEAYSTSTLDSDVALVVLKKNLIYTRTVQPVELAAWGDHLPNDGANEFIVSGWGLTSETGSVSPLLSYVSVHLINQNTCSKNYQYIATISAQMFCAGSAKGGKDSCQGDSGGPLVAYTQVSPTPPAPPPLLASSPKPLLSPFTLSLPLTSSLLSTTESDVVLELQANAVKPKQYGIVSWGVGCGEESYPGVYANVAALRPWIDEKLSKVKYLFKKKRFSIKIVKSD